MFKIIQTFLSQKEKLEICFLFNTKSIFDNINDELNKSKIKYKEVKNDPNFEQEMCAMSSNFLKEIKKFQFNGHKSSYDFEKFSYISTMKF